MVQSDVLQSMQPAWSTCYGDIRGFYDPPVALQPASSVAGPEITSTMMRPTSATPASGPAVPYPSRTATTASANTPSPSGGSQIADASSQTQYTQSVDRGAGNPSEPPQNSGAGSQLQDTQSADTGTGALSSSAQSLQASTQNIGGIVASLLGSSTRSTPGSDLSDSTNGSEGPSTHSGVESSIDGISNNSPSSSNAGSNAISDLAQSTAVVGTQVITTVAGSSPGGGGSSGDVIAQGGSSITLISGASGNTISGQQVSAQSDGLIMIGTEEQSQTLYPAPTNPFQGSSGKAVTIGSQAITIAFTGEGNDPVTLSQDGSSVVITPGAVATTINGQPISALQGGSVVVGTGSTASTIVVPTAGSVDPNSGASESPSLVHVSSLAFTVFVQSDGTEVSTNGETTFTFSPEAAPTSVNAQVINTNSAGHITVGSSTIFLASSQGQHTGAATTFSFGSHTYTISGEASGDDIVDLGFSTITLSPGGPSAPLGPDTISEATNGDLVFYSGSPITTVPFKSSSYGTTMTSSQFAPTSSNNISTVPSFTPMEGLADRSSLALGALMVMSVSSVLMLMGCRIL